MKIFLAIALSLLLSPAAVRSETPEDKCYSAVMAGIAKLQGVKGLEVSKYWRDDTASETAADYLPNGRPRSIAFTIDGKAANSVMRSPQFLLSIGQRIINDCPDVSTVTVIVNRSAWSETIGYFEGGAIRRFECFEGMLDRRTRIPYGYLNCDI